MVLPGRLVECPTGATELGLLECMVLKEAMLSLKVRLFLSIQSSLLPCITISFKVLRVGYWGGLTSFCSM